MSTYEHELRLAAEALIEVVADYMGYGEPNPPRDGEGTARPRKDFEEYVRVTLDSIPTDDPKIDYTERLLSWTCDLIDELRGERWLY